MVLVLAAVALAAILVVAIVTLSRRALPEGDTVEEKLPVGAEAALWSIVEAVPDPRNHLALTRDLTGEVRITGTPLDPAHRATSSPGAPTSPRPAPPQPAPSTAGQAPTVRIRSGALEVHGYDRAS